MDGDWSKRDAPSGCHNCWAKPEQVAVIKISSTHVRVCIDCLNLLRDTAETLIDTYDGYDDD